MNDEIRKQFQTIIREAQFKINSLSSGYKVVLLESERTEADVQSDVARALHDREGIGLGGSDAPEFAAPHSLDSASREDRELIERALQESSGLEVQK
jgi:hypothetical protein